MPNDFSSVISSSRRRDATFVTPKSYLSSNPHATMAVPSGLPFISNQSAGWGQTTNSAVYRCIWRVTGLESHNATVGRYKAIFTYSGHTPVEVNGKSYTTTLVPVLLNEALNSRQNRDASIAIVQHCSFCYSVRTGGYRTFIRTLASSKPSKARSCLNPIEHCLLWSNLTNGQGVRPRELFAWGGFSSSTWRYLVGSLLPPSLYLIRLPVFSGTGLSLHNWLRVGDSRTVSCSHTRWGHPMFLRIYRYSKCQEAGRLYRTSSRISGGIPPQEHLHNTVQPPTHSSEHIVFPAHRRELQWRLNPLSPPQNTVKWDFHPPIYLHFYGAPNSYCTNSFKNDSSQN